MKLLTIESFGKVDVKNSDRMDASKETIDSLIKDASKTVGELYPVLRQEICTLDACGRETSLLLRLALELKMDLHFILINLGTSLHSLLVASKPVEKRFHLKILLAELHEDFKLLCGYGKARNRAIWTRVGDELRKRNESRETEIESSLLDLYDTLTSFLDGLIGSEQEKAGRDLTFHYDDDFSLVYHYTLETNNEETVVLKAIHLMDVVSRLQTFCGFIEAVEAINGNRLLNVRPQAFSWLAVQKMFAAKLGEHSLLQETLKYAIDKAPVIDQAAKMKDGMDRMRDYVQGFRPRIDFPELGEMEAMANTQLLLQFTLSDLAIATQAYINSGSEPEFPLIMRRLTITRVSALSHLYGYNESEREKSMWTSIRGMIPGNADQLKAIADDIEKMLNGAVDAADKDDRQLYVHLSDKKGVSNIPSIVERMEHMNPVKELSKTECLIRIITKIQSFLRDLMDQMAAVAHTRAEASSATMLSQIQSIRDAVNKSKCPDDLKATVNSQMDYLEKLVKDPLSVIQKKA